MTPVDEILERLHFESTVFCRMTLHGAWGFHKGTLSGAPFHLILGGTAWLERDGEDGELLRAGDIAILPRGDEHRLLSQPGAPAVPFTDVSSQMGLSPWLPGTRYRTVDFRFGSGAVTTTLVSGVFSFGDHRRNPLFEALPRLLLLHGSGDGEEVRVADAVTRLLDAELLSGTPGAEIVSTRLADILFIQVVRRYLHEAAALPRGWLRGMTDPAIAPALTLMQRSPGKSWSVETLAQAVGMSRSRFAARFQEIVGRGPLEYLTNWRMYVAAGRLTEPGRSLPDVAASVGYRSEVSFSKAFKRWSDQTPAEYRRSRSTRPMTPPPIGDDRPASS